MIFDENFIHINDNSKIDLVEREACALTCFSQPYNLHIDTSFVNSYSPYKIAQLTIKCCIRETRKIQELSEALRKNDNTITELHLDSILIISPSILTSLINLKHISIYKSFDDIKGDIKEFQQYLFILTINGLS
ncbi:hypothetical protein GLOIN_2v1644672 [Rhizophagus clarus]|uniref:Uncharacterized protein n=1 Tax=Rhizophagus clarus TaxID=94130 RepID=A0A8H3L4N5_9GLOM|nr:hypothetical protein GLOIN_2v1644672 [Rhizophagus clarus]